MALSEMYSEVNGDECKTDTHSDAKLGWLVGWLVYSYTNPPFGMQGV